MEKVYKVYIFSSIIGIIVSVMRRFAGFSLNQTIALVIICILISSLLIYIHKE